MVCEHKTSEQEVRFNLPLRRKEYFCLKCGKLVKTKIVSKEEILRWVKKNDPQNFFEAEVALRQ
jgi:hypothetical protein